MDMLVCKWTGEVMEPVPAARRRAGERFAIDEIYRIEVREERSLQSHNHEFAAIQEAWANLPDHLAALHPTAEHLRKHALIACGFCDQRSIVCGSKAEAQRVAAFIKPMDEYAIVVAKEAVVIVYTAQSQSARAMGKSEFQRSKQAVLDYCAALLGTSGKDLTANAGKAA